MLTKSALVATALVAAMAAFLPAQQASPEPEMNGPRALHSASFRHDRSVSYAPERMMCVRRSLTRIVRLSGGGNAFG